jgi:multidrug transporter EmrE-like cation transporter
MTPYLLPLLAIFVTVVATSSMRKSGRMSASTARTLVVLVTVLGLIALAIDVWVVIR